MRVCAIACVIVLPAATLGNADVLYPAALMFELGYAIGPKPEFPWSAYPSVGSPFLWIGRVAQVSDNFRDLLPPGSFELTYAFTSTCQSAENWDNQPCSGGEAGVFRDGTLLIHLDTTPDAEFTNLSTFFDGDVVLMLQMSFMFVTDDDPHEVCPMLNDEPDIIAHLTFVGGLWFDRVSHEGAGFEATVNGELERDVPADLQDIGFVFQANGTLDIYGPVPTAQTTWGAVKAFYR